MKTNGLVLFARGKHAQCDMRSLAYCKFQRRGFALVRISLEFYLKLSWLRLHFENLLADSASWLCVEIRRVYFFHCIISSNNLQKILVLCSWQYTTGKVVFISNSSPTVHLGIPFSLREWGLVLDTTDNRATLSRPEWHCIPFKI